MTEKVIKNSQGFSLIEILVAITLVAVLFGIFASFSFNSSDHLEEASNNIERAIRYSVDESALRNSIVRTRFYLDGTPQKMSVEYGPDDSFVIPLNQVEPEEESLLNKESNKKKLKKFNLNFNRVPEFSEGPRSFNENVRLVGIGSSLTGLLFLEGQVSIYAYPTGEKDGGIIILGTTEQVVGISFRPFLLGFDYKRENIDKSISFDEIPEEQERVAKEMFESWLKK